MVVWRYDHIHCLVLSKLVSRPDSLLATNKASVFLFAYIQSGARNDYLNERENKIFNIHTRGVSVIGLRVALHGDM
jgi:hypothetical protein